MHIGHDVSVNGAQAGGGYIVMHHFFNDGRRIPVDTVCRIGAYNLVMTNELPNPTNALENEQFVDYRAPDGLPDPVACNSTIWTNTSQGTSVCLQGDKVLRDRCPEGTFADPALPAGYGIDFHAVKKLRPARNDKSIYLSGFYTAAQALGKQPDFALTCDGIHAREDSDDGAWTRLRGGQSIFVENQIFRLDSALVGDPKQCELVVSFAGKTLGTFCIAGTTTTAGACT
jgi:hypothetical protein